MSPWFAFGLLAACAAPAPDQRPLVAFEGETMGTYYRVQVAGEEMTEERRRTVHEAAVEAMEQVNASMSTYLEDSEISRFNRHLQTSPFTVSAATFEVLRTAVEVSAATGGAFDVTVGPLVDAWGFGPASTPARQLEDEEIEELLGRIGYDELLLDEAASTVTKSLGELHCDLSGIAKGYAVDRVAERLASLGFSDYWVEIGGEVRAAGTNARGKAWRLGIERPLQMPGAVQRIVPLDHLAVATSGDYRNYREIDGERFSHLIDPRDGRPIRHRLASVSVFHPRCTVADAWATALMVLGEDEGYEVAVAENLAALFLVRDGDEVVELATPAFRKIPSPLHLRGRPARNGRGRHHPPSSLTPTLSRNGRGRHHPPSSLTPTLSRNGRGRHLPPSSLTPTLSRNGRGRHLPPWELPGGGSQPRRGRQDIARGVSPGETGRNSPTRKLHTRNSPTP